MSKSIRFAPWFALLSFASIAAADPYPGADWETVAPESVGVDAERLNRFMDYGMLDDEKRNPDALLVVHRGKIVAERYAYGFHRDMRHLSWSIAKSVNAVLMGVAESEGIVSRGTRVRDFFPFPARTPAEAAHREKLTLLHLLTMTSGFDWWEDYTAKKPLQSDVIQMLYMDARKDRAAFVASRPMIAAPGEHFYYSTGDMALSQGVLKYRMPTEAYDDYPWTRLFDRIGMKGVVWERDASGTFDGGSSIYATARDYARFGYLLLRNGKWNDERIVPEEWVRLLHTLSPGLAGGSVPPEGTKTYGTGFWLNQAAPKWNLSLPYPAAPGDLYFALGHNGQMITIVPSKDLVVVRLAHDLGDDVMDWNGFFGRIVAAIDGESPVPAESSRDSAAREILVGTEAEPAPPVYAKKRTSVIHFTKLLAAVRAKDYCSCRFVVGQSVEYCTNLVKNGFPLLRKKIDEDARKATFGVLPAQSARWESERFGCALM